MDEVEAGINHHAAGSAGLSRWLPIEPNLPGVRVSATCVIKLLHSFHHCPHGFLSTCPTAPLQKCCVPLPGGFNMRTRGIITATHQNTQSNYPPHETTRHPETISPTYWFGVPLSRSSSIADRHRSGLRSNPNMNSGMILPSVVMAGWPLLVAYWLLRGAPPIIGAAYPDSEGRSESETRIGGAPGKQADA
jgi:hypothetical protein